jgi:hypothetical protein
MAEDPSEWKQKSKVWTYLIMIMVLVGIVILINVVWNDPKRAENGIKDFFGLPGWALASITFVVGALVFWGGLKVEPEWPEALGAILVGGSVAAFEMIIGWNRFDFGGMVVIPYLIPLVVVVIMMMYAMKRGM